MNKERILALADHIEKLPHYNDVDEAGPHFTMSRYFNPCGSPSCIAGHAICMFSDKKFEDVYGSEFNEAAEVLGLGWETANKLFTPSALEAGKFWSMITPKEAARTLRHLAETGEVKWFNPLI